MKLASYLTAGVVVAAGLALSTAAQAQDGALMSSGDLYFNGTIGGSALIFSGSSNVAKTYYGVDASGEVCRANPGGFDFCGGLNVFHTLGNGKKTTGTMTTSTRVASVGGFVKARKQMEQVGIAPYVGLRRYFTQTTVTGVGATTKLTDNANAVYGGVELDYSLVEDRVYLTMKAEVGRTFGAQTNRTTVLLSPGLKVKF
ncbi:hypothetical protein ABWH89_09860 [Hoeflea alexandrii]|uniref:hypothetical protein n=1 Tax=Hoeflea alexandrii TaxID=288436 RepID=UPI0035D0C0C9